MIVNGFAKKQESALPLRGERDGSSMSHKPTELLYLVTCFTVLLSFPSRVLSEEPTAKGVAAVAPPVGAVTAPELKACAVEIREQLRFHGYRLAVQADVRAAMAAAGAKGKPTMDQLKQTAQSVGADLLFVSVVSQNEVGDMYFETAALNMKTGTARAVRAKLPSRGAMPYRSEHFLPSVATGVARLLDTPPNPIHGPFPQIIEIDPKRLIRKETAPSKIPTPPSVPPPATKPDESVSKPGSETGGTEPKSATIQVGPEKPENADKKKKRDWKKWDHAGLFGELGFMFSWCRQEGMCSIAGRGYAARIRFGVRIASYVALSFSAVAADHQMPITTDTNVFLNVKQALVYAAIFGGLRVHPIRRFPVDPYVGIDLGYSWLLYASNTLVQADPNIPTTIANQLGSMMTTRRETIYLKGFTATPEFGVNFFVAPPLAFGLHVQWLLPRWKHICSRVYDPTVQGLKSTARICTTMDRVSATNSLNVDTREMLSQKDNIPRFVSLELDLVFVFK